VLIFPGSLGDNYYLSLVEQEICTQAHVFVGSIGSTWTEYIRDDWQAKKLQATTFYSLVDLLRKNGFKFLEHEYWTWVLNKPH